MKKEFGEKVQRLRQEKGLTREELCGDEIELSVRQLARIESGQSLPTLAKVQYISEKLGVSVGSLTDGENLELPKRYKELKYQILRLPTYADEERLQLREEQFDEILNVYYDHLPEVEQVMVDILQSRFEVVNSGDVNFGLGVLNDYFEQVKKKKFYAINDLALIDLYLTCMIATMFSGKESQEGILYSEETYAYFVEKLLKQGDYLPTEDLFFLNKIYFMLASVFLRQNKFVDLDALLTHLHPFIIKSQDFQRMPLYYMYRWKYCLYHLKDKSEAESYYHQATMFAEMTQDSYLAKRLDEEWEMNTRDE
ncbi:helix-turn-helix domain-containing protein [Streptococcus plurextorum]|uniref:helix-turn-helix domain-containing protein n=1 Tax=Streptococcus plurextorum TaxID=456876 RepID=UPI0003F9B3E0|nr:helix-turn-helix domain-containing protein [Streptococcus plurextorum]